MRMDVRALTTLIAVVDHRSFSAAARSLGYTQSAVSQQIAALEAQVGLPLVVRRPVSPTPAGERFVEHAREIVLAAGAATAEARRAAEGPPTAPRVLVSPAADLLVDPAPLVAAGTIGIADAAAALAALATGECDVAVIDGVSAPGDPLPPRMLPAVRVTQMDERDVAVLLPADHPLAGRSGLELTAVRSAIWLDTPALPCAAAQVARALDVPLRTGPAYRGARTGIRDALVAAGAGLAWCRADDPVGPGLVAVPLVTPRLTHRVEVWWPRTAPAAVTALVDRLSAGAGAA